LTTLCNKYLEPKT